MLTAVAAQASETSTSSGTTGEEVLFWILAPLAVLGALGLVLSRKAVHGALFLAMTMVSLALLFLALEAPFLGVVQIVVYTGAIMMLFLFVIMLVGVDATDSRVETIRGQRGAAALAVLGVLVLLTAVTGRAALPDPIGTDEATPDGNVYAIADLIFGRYVWAFEVVAIVLITAAVGAMALTHKERVTRRLTQRELSERRFRDGDPRNAAGLPVPGVYARHNAVDTPALLPDGTPAESSVPAVLVARGAARPAEEFAEDIGEIGPHGQKPSGLQPQGEGDQPEGDATAGEGGPNDDVPADDGGADDDGARPDQDEADGGDAR
ncbi:NADH-quinone oxidoreductase subunit J [Phytoactinopolyspora halotolerans]|uniref:NADH-quinone oxidoreductase subunit J n=1 Tax=Phytoactinopolyspora halotolerans TaxID=1981512 RepID=A0A6L9S6L6_9ACTN|nr:NADH-quinone oxidoreductase subunit J [Phytoactinopolyspora halotolerans]